ncbi:hypothetical protein F2Q69_00049759 [Brassica cretica]|uniref:Uncharacterized protein n=1 Tax=Brassica cretica TaxID=69181 RepID=A0A8S9PUY0_BRACR|nr:hypothetical protein F2Q69_00049759 [Brassica cretica]
MMVESSVASSEAHVCLLRVLTFLDVVGFIDLERSGSIDSAQSDRIGCVNFRIFVTAPRFPSLVPRSPRPRLLLLELDYFLWARLLATGFVNLEDDLEDGDGVINAYSSI